MGFDRIVFLLFFLGLRTIWSLKLMKTLSNELNDYYEFNYGDESVVKDYVTLAEDPKGDLPEKFTLCSSVFANSVAFSFYQLYTVSKMKKIELDSIMS